jgi:hypothetical protein
MKFIKAFPIPFTLLISLESFCMDRAAVAAIFLDLVHFARFSRFELLISRIQIQIGSSALLLF